MRIAINYRFGTYAYQEGYASFTNGISSAMAKQCPEDRFMLCSDRKPAMEIALEGNQEWLVGGPPARHPLLWKYWYDVKWPKMASRAQADVLLSPDGFCSLNTSIPQVIVIHDLAFLHFPTFLPRTQQWYYRTYTAAFIRKARRIITVSEFSRDDIIAHYPAAKGKIEVVHNATESDFHSWTWEEREKIKERYTAGSDYFICVGSMHPRKNLVNLLKGFSAFKKRQKSNMKLVIVGRLAWQTESFMEALRTFKFREDVILTGYIPRFQLTELTGAAYALVYPSLWEGFGLPVLEAMRSGVPVLASGNSAVPELAGTAALYFDPYDPSSIGAEMMRIYKEELRKKAMSQEGLIRAAAFQWDRSAKQVREILADAVNS